MILDRKDIVIGLLVVLVSLQCFVGTLMAGALMRVEQSSIGVQEAHQIVSMVERVQAINEVCVQMRVSADQSLINYLLPANHEGDRDHGKVRDQNTGSGSGLRGVRLATGDP